MIRSKIKVDKLKKGDSTLVNHNLKFKEELNGFLHKIIRISEDFLRYKCRVQIQTSSERIRSNKQYQSFSVESKLKEIIGDIDISNDARLKENFFLFFYKLFITCSKPAKNKPKQNPSKGSALLTPSSSSKKSHFYKMSASFNYFFLSQKSKIFLEDKSRFGAQDSDSDSMQQISINNFDYEKFKFELNSILIPNKNLSTGNIIVSLINCWFLTVFIQLKNKIKLTNENFLNYVSPQFSQVTDFKVLCNFIVTQNQELNKNIFIDNLKFILGIFPCCLKSSLLYATLQYISEAFLIIVERNFEQYNFKKFEDYYNQYNVDFLVWQKDFFYDINKLFVECGAQLFSIIINKYEDYKYSIKKNQEIDYNIFQIHKVKAIKYIPNIIFLRISNILKSQNKVINSLDSKMLGLESVSSSKLSEVNNLNIFNHLLKVYLLNYAKYKFINLLIEQMYYSKVEEVEKSNRKCLLYSTSRKQQKPKASNSQQIFKKLIIENIFSEVEFKKDIFRRATTKLYSEKLNIGQHSLFKADIKVNNLTPMISEKYAKNSMKENFSHSETYNKYRNWIFSPIKIFKKTKGKLREQVNSLFKYHMCLRFYAYLDLKSFSSLVKKINEEIHELMIKILEIKTKKLEKYFLETSNKQKSSLKRYFQYAYIRPLQYSNR